MRPLKETWLRLRSETPTHFKRIIYGAVTLGGICGTVLLLPIAFPAIVVTVLQAGVTAGVVAAAVAKSATKDPEKIIEELNNKTKQ